jgi:hypothetical protein
MITRRPHSYAATRRAYRLKISKPPERQPGRLNDKIGPLAFCPQAHQPCQAPFAMGRVAATSASAAWRTAAVRSGPDSQVKKVVTMTKRTIIRWWP